MQCFFSWLHFRMQKVRWTWPRFWPLFLSFSFHTQDIIAIDYNSVSQVQLDTLHDLV